MKKSTKSMFFALLAVVGFASKSFAQPTANFSWTPTSPCTGNTVQVSDQSTPSGSITAWGYSVTGASSPSYAVQNPIITFTASGTQTITLAVLQGTTPSAPVSKTVNVLPSPNVTVSTSNTLACPGNSVTITATGNAVTYSWQPGGQITSSIVVSPSVSTTYSVIGTGTNTCARTWTFTQNIVPSPINVSSTSSLLCVGQSATLTATGGTAYTWAPVTSTLSTVVISPTITSSYTVSSQSTVCPSYTWTAVFSQSVSACTGVKEAVASNVSFDVYPNPTSGDLTVELKNGASKTIEVMDMTGRVVYSSISSNDKIVVNMSTLARGIYYVRVQSNNTIEVARVVKQ
jgi:hypothetical protein